MIFLAILITTILTFLFFPKLDIWVSSHFFDGERFHNKTQGLFGFIYDITPIITATIIAICIIAILVLIITKKPLGIWNKPAIAFVLLSLTLGPGIIVNAVLKTHWDRARPAHIEEFGGTKNFTSPLIPSDQCEKNCSLASGHAAVGFFLMVFAFLYPKHYRAWIITGIASGALIGLARIAQGGHFLSDVIFSGLITYAAIWLCYQYIYKKHNQESKSFDSINNR